MKHPSPIRILTLLLSFAMPGAANVARAQDPRATQEAITRSLQEFLARNDEPGEHDRFWADDLVYTSSRGEVTSKAEIMKAVSGPAPDPAAPHDTYSAEDILVRPYGSMAALTFRLVRHAPDGATHYYRNSGTLVLREGRWQVITWQATAVADAAAKPSK